MDAMHQGSGDQSATSRNTTFRIFTFFMIYPPYMSSALSWYKTSHVREALSFIERHILRVRKNRDVYNIYIYTASIYTV